MPQATKIDEIYQRFSAIWSDSVPIVDQDKLAAAIRAAGSEPADVTDEWLRSLSEQWVYGKSDKPFEDIALNMKYQRIQSARA